MPDDQKTVTKVFSSLLCDYQIDPQKYKDHLPPPAVNFKFSNLQHLILSIGDSNQNPMQYQPTSKSSDRTCFTWPCLRCFFPSVFLPKCIRRIVQSLEQICWETLTRRRIHWVHHKANQQRATCPTNISTMHSAVVFLGRSVPLSSSGFKLPLSNGYETATE